MAEGFFFLGEDGKRAPVRQRDQTEWWWRVGAVVEKKK